MQYGTYTTFDVPHHKNVDIADEIKDKAFEYLKNQFNKIDGKVKIKMNEHDFGPYPSFEIDYPDYIENIKDNEDDLLNTNDSNTTELLDKLDEWHRQADIIYDNYLEKFKKHL